MFRESWDRLQRQFWFRPALWTLMIGLLAVGVNVVDSRLITITSDSDYAWLLLGDVDGARTVLGSIATATLTVTSVTFSILMVAIVQTANAYSPRILNEYISDTANQHVLGIMIGTFLYSLITLRDVRSLTEQNVIPVLNVNVALMLALATIFAFIYFLHHIAMSIKVDNIIKLLLSTAEEILPGLFPSEIGEPLPEAAMRLPDSSGVGVVCEKGGYVNWFDSKRLINVAQENDLLIQLECRIGDYVFVGSRLATVWPAADGETVAALQSAVAVSSERSTTHDLLFDVRQLSDMAIRALSPGINDPNTAVSCIDALTTLVIDFAARPAITSYRADAASTLRVIAPVFTFEEVLYQSFDQIREYGTGDVAATVRVLHACGEIARFVREEEQRATVWRFVKAVMNSADRKLEDAASRRAVNLELEKISGLFLQSVDPLLLPLASE